VTRDENEAKENQENEENEESEESEDNENEGDYWLNVRKQRDAGQDTYKAELLKLLEKRRENLYLFYFIFQKISICIYFPKILF